MESKALQKGTLIRGGHYTYRIDDILVVDGQGFTYKTTATVEKDGETFEIPAVVREQMMTRCSTRGEDGVTVVTAADIGPTVESCLQSFIASSLEREKISKTCPWIINVIETFSANNTYYYAVEYLDGETFGEYVERMGGSLTFEQTRKALSPVFEAVKALHANRALHTDIHPGHIRFVNRGGERFPVLFSLYATLHFGDKGLQRWTLPMMVCKQGFAPPEQYFEINHFAPQVDIYALASLIVFALSGKVLPDSRKITERTIRSYLPPSLPETVVQALLNALNPDMTVRTATITRFREEMGTFRKNAPSVLPASLIDEVAANSQPRSLLSRILHIFHRR